MAHFFASKRDLQKRFETTHKNNPHRPQIHPNRPQILQNRHPNDSKLIQNRPQRPQDRPRAAKSTPRAARRRAKTAPRSPKSGPGQPKSGPRAAKTAPRRPKTAPRCPKTVPRSPSREAPPLLKSSSVILGRLGSPWAVLSSTRSGARAAKIALELRLPMFQSFLEVRLGRVEVKRPGLVTRPLGE